MRTAGLKPGDVVDVEIKGQQFWATITEKQERGMMVKPLFGLLSERRVGPRAIKGGYSKRAGSR